MASKTKFKIYSPLEVKVSAKRKFILNLNQYRNTHYRISNTAKIKYKEFISSQLDELNVKISKCVIVYTVYKGDTRRFDIGNICAIHQKFFEDALTEAGIITDDKHDVIPVCVFASGGVDNVKPRVEIEVFEMSREVHKQRIVNVFKEIIEGRF